MRTAIRYLAYPSVLGLSACSLVWWLGGPHHWAIPGVVAAIAIAAVAWLEQVAPSRVAWNQDHGDSGADLIHALVNWGLLAGAALSLHGIGPSGSVAWPASWPAWAQLLVAGAILDVGLYAMHRLSHHAHWLWRLHAMHHTSERLYWLNGERRHPLSALVLATPGLLIVVALGAPPPVISAWFAILAIHLAFQHANLDYRLGPLRYVFAVAESHRHHHRRSYTGAQVNYGEFWMIWDVLLGTFVSDPDDDELVGLEDEVVPGDYTAQLLWPFRRGAPQRSE